MGESSAQERQVASGRLLCDTYLMAKDLVRSKNYSLTELAFNQLNFNRVDIDSEKVGNHFWKIEDLSLLVNICECDAYLCSLLMFKLQIIPLTLQLTKLAGNLW